MFLYSTHLKGSIDVFNLQGATFYYLATLLRLMGVAQSEKVLCPYNKSEKKSAFRVSGPSGSENEKRPSSSRFCINKFGVVTLR